MDIRKKAFLRSCGENRGLGVRTQSPKCVQSVEHYFYMPSHPVFNCSVSVSPEEYLQIYSSWETASGISVFGMLGSTTNTVQTYDIVVVFEDFFLFSMWKWTPDPAYLHALFARSKTVASSLLASNASVTRKCWFQR